MNNNAPVFAVGRNPDKVSAVVQAENAAFALARADMMALPPANSNENARQHRACLMKHASAEAREKFAAQFAEFGLAV